MLHDQELHFCVHTAQTGTEHDDSSQWGCQHGHTAHQPAQQDPATMGCAALVLSCANAVSRMFLV